MTLPAALPELPRPQTLRPGLTADPLWYKDAIIYQVHVRGYADSDDDGVGDFPGLTRRLDYIKSLGVSAIWLQPFYPSPLKDDGYDIAHYKGVHTSYGTMRDFRHFLDQAHARGLRVITELVINHTSDQHPWFQAARRARAGTSKRNFYVWSDSDHQYADARVIFTDTERSNWTWDPVANAYYWHRFFRHQPDLNFDNPSVQRAVLKVMKFWFDMGVDGMRLDAVPYLIEREGTTCENLPETHGILRQIRSELDAHYAGKMLLAEANQWPSDVRAYFGEGDECHMAFHFPLMPRLFMALQREDRHPISEILWQTPDIPANCQWAIFLRNHDELTLEMVTDEERDYMYRHYAADPQMRLNVGIRRRLAPLVENSRARIELLNGLLLSLPGTPVIYYGDEIGMGDNIYLGDRNGVRTPMQWTADRNAGFSRADPARLFAPPVMDSVYGYQAVNVEAQERSPHSMLNWMRRATALRQQHQVFGRGSMEILRPANRRILAFVRRIEGSDPILVVANLARSMQAVTLDLPQYAGLVPVEMSGGTELPRITDAPLLLTLSAHGFCWLELRREPPQGATVRAAAVTPEASEDLSPLLIGAEWSGILSTSVKRMLERIYLMPFLRRQRWFAKRAQELTSATIDDWGLLKRGHEPVFLTIVTAAFADGVTDRYVVPLAMTTDTGTLQRDAPDAMIAPLGGARRGLLHGRVDAAIAQLLFDAIAGRHSLTMASGSAVALQTEAFASVLRALPNADLTPHPVGVEQSNSSVLFGERFILKTIRRLWAGRNPELELGRFLTETAHFPRTPALAGAIEYRRRDAEPDTLVLIHEAAEHQMDGWRHALNAIERFLDHAPSSSVKPDLPPDLDPWSHELPESARATVGGYLNSAATLGRRTAELHLALASEAATAEFGAGSMDRPALAALVEAIGRETDETLATLTGAMGTLADDAADAARRLIARRDDLLTRVEQMAAAVPDGLLTSRIHGDYHLGQVLVHEEDFTIVDFEGEPGRPIPERRRLQSPFKDVAGMVRSFHYATGAALLSKRSASPAAAAGVARWARWWQTWNTVSFLHAYGRATAGAPFAPPDPAGATALLRLFLIEKAQYELRYEARYRPGWIGIPLVGLLDILE